MVEWIKDPFETHRTLNTRHLENHTTLTIRIDWSEMDLFGHVNNVQILKYVQAARVHFWEVIGLSGSFEERGVGAMVASVACQFRKPLHYPGNVHLKTQVVHVGATSFKLRHFIYNDAGELCAEAEDAEVLFDFTENEKVQITDTLRNHLTAYLGTTTA